MSVGTERRAVELACHALDPALSKCPCAVHRYALAVVAGINTLSIT